MVELNFSWFRRDRRLAKDFENLAGTLETFVTLAAIQLAIRRLARTLALSNTAPLQRWVLLPGRTQR